jgi:hypothetical protein
MANVEKIRFVQNEPLIEVLEVCYCKVKKVFRALTSFEH